MKFIPIFVHLITFFSKRVHKTGNKTNYGKPRIARKCSATSGLDFGAKSKRENDGTTHDYMMIKDRWVFYQ